MCTLVCVHACVHIGVYVHACVHIGVCVPACVHIGAWVCIHVNVCKGRGWCLVSSFLSILLFEHGFLLNMELSVLA